MTPELQKINQYLKNILGAEKAYFGRIRIWELGQKPDEYKDIGFVPTEDFMPLLKSLTEEQRKNLVRIATYFEIHARPLKNLLNADDPEKLYTEIAWSHFATVIMFGMLEAVVKIQTWAKFNKYENLDPKGSQIRKFLEDNLPQETKNGVIRRYSTEDIFNHKKATSFGEVVDHMWEHVRSGFVHNMGVEHKGLDYGTLIGMGTKDDPIRSKTDVPMQEWLQMTWQAILNSHGYTGKLEHSR